MWSNIIRQKLKYKQMKKIRIETKTVIKYLFYAIICIVTTAGMGNILSNIYYFIKDPVAAHAKYDLISALRKEKKKVYAYNEQVPIEVVKQEIIKQAKLFGNDVQFMLDLAECESSFNNLADNPNSTAKGVFQFVALTWEETESNKSKISEFDYKANIREANIKIANQEYSHWVDCVNKIKSQQKQS